MPTRGCGVWGTRPPGRSPILRDFLFGVLFDDQADACAHGLVCE
jgi:hypothetical protein